LLKFIFLTISIIFIIVLLIYISLKSRQEVFQTFTIQEFIHKNDIDSEQNYTIEENKSLIDLINDFFEGKYKKDDIHDDDDGDGGDDGGL
jgi:hypothetical protein